MTRQAGEAYGGGEVGSGAPLVDNSIKYLIDVAERHMRYTCDTQCSSQVLRAAYSYHTIVKTVSKQVVYTKVVAEL